MHADDLPRGIRVLVAAHQASERRGGAAAISIRLFGRLRASGTEAWLVTHDSERAELRETWRAAEFNRVFFVPSLPGLQPVFTWGERLPPGLRSIAWGITQLERQAAMAPAVRRLVRDLGIDVVHQPISVSPVMPSPLTRVGAPVVMGPLNGGMTAPPAFRDRDSGLVALIHRARSPLALAANTIVRGRAGGGCPADRQRAHPRSAARPGPAACGPCVGHRGGAGLMAGRDRPAASGRRCRHPLPVHRQAGRLEGRGPAARLVRAAGW